MNSDVALFNFLFGGGIIATYSIHVLGNSKGGHENDAWLTLDASERGTAMGTGDGDRYCLSFFTSSSIKSSTHTVVHSRLAAAPNAMYV